MTPAVLWVLLVFVYLPTPHWGVASIEFPYSDTSGNRAPMVSTFLQFEFFPFLFLFSR